MVVVGGAARATACPCPRPTKLREMPGLFGSSGGVFLLAPNLAAKLNIKVGWDVPIQVTDDNVAQGGGMG